MRIDKIIQWGVLKCGRSGVGGLPQIKPNAYPYSSFPKCPMRGSIFGTSKPLGNLNSVQCVCDWWKCISKKLFWKLLQHIVSLTRSKWNDLVWNWKFIRAAPKCKSFATLSPSNFRFEGLHPLSTPGLPQVGIIYLLSISHRWIT